MRALLIVVVVAVAVAGCIDGPVAEGEDDVVGEGEGEGGPSGRRTEITCPAAPALVDVSRPPDGGLTTLVDARVEDGLAVLEFSGRSIGFTVAPSRPPAFPPLGPVRVEVGEDVVRCGDGCDPTWWVVRDDDGVPWFELGALVRDDDRGFIAGPGVDDPVTLVDGASASCSTGAGDAIALGVVATDGGDVTVAPGGAVGVTIDGVAFVFAVGSAARLTEEVFFADEDCTGCLPPGTHVSTELTALLYRTP